jgi:hypothetical protein
MEDLRFTPRAIKEAEDKLKGKPITSIMSEASMTNLSVLVEKGYADTEDGAFRRIERYFDEGGDLMHLYLLIMEKLRDAHFLPRDLDLTEAKAALASQTQNQSSSENTGN